MELNTDIQRLVFQIDTAEPTKSCFKTSAAFCFPAAAMPRAMEVGRRPPFRIEDELLIRSKNPV
jgi:hypothetical protein